MEMRWLSMGRETREETFVQSISYALPKLDILVLHTEQEPWILGLPFFIHT
jgi:hypothetical protein